VTHGEDALYEEIAFVAGHYHWPLAEILDLEHATRVRFIRAVGALGLDG
jgi:hypothetical protein